MSGAGLGGQGMSRGVWATTLLLVAVGVGAPAAAQTAPLAPDPPAASAYREPPPSVLGAPVAIKGEPVEPNATPAPATESLLPPPPTVAPAAASVPAPQPQPQPQSQPQPQPNRTATLGAPTNAAVIPAGAVEAPARTAPTGPPADPVNDLLARRSTYTKDGPPGSTTDYPAEKIGEKIEGILGQRHEWFHS